MTCWGHVIGAWEMANPEKAKQLFLLSGLLYHNGHLFEAYNAIDKIKVSYNNETITDNEAYQAYARLIEILLKECTIENVEILKVLNS